MQLNISPISPNHDGFFRLIYRHFQILPLIFCNYLIINTEYFKDFLNIITTMLLICINFTSSNKKRRQLGKSGTNKMKALIIDNKIYFVNDYDFVKMSLIVPALNLEKMRLATKCRIISKEEVNVTFNHNAGRLFKVTIDVRFINIVTYLKTGDVYSCENKAAF